MTIDQVQLTTDQWENFWNYYKGEPQQKQAVEMLRQFVNEADPTLLTQNATWIQKYRERPATLQPASSNLLDVGYFSQNDNLSGTGYRECFSSSCAMVASFYGKIDSDDDYNVIRSNYGDSTDANAQIRALRQLGLKATFHTDGNPDRLKDLIDQGIPVPCGWLHHGNVSAPTGGGHYSVVVGYRDEVWIHNDPNGVANLYAGGYTNDLYGYRNEYSAQNWLPRWECDGPSTGWYMLITE